LPCSKVITLMGYPCISLVIMFCGGGGVEDVG